MGQLLQLIATSIAISALGAQALIAQPQKEPEFCALRITLLGYTGQTLLTNAPLPIKIVASKDGKVWRTFWTKVGKVEICDVDPEPFEVVVGFDGFAQVVVKDLRLFWRETLDLRVMWDPFVNLGESVPWNGCRFFVKVRDAGGAPVPGSVVSFDSWEDREVDRFGRIFLSVPTGATRTAVVKATGFRDTSRVLACPKGFVDQSVTIELPRADGAAPKPDQER
ncbi:MAG: hypothetical protein ACLQGV_09705 [Bryobacteraceae bacterium]